jgi:hypothetical protein
MTDLMVTMPGCSAITRLDILALAAELTEVAGFEVGLEQDLGRCRFEPEKRD